MKLLKSLLAIAGAIGALFVSDPAFATCSNYTSYSDGQVLTAASLNSLQTNYTNCINAVLDGDTFSGNMSWYSGADALFYTDGGVTKSAEILGEGGDVNLYSGSNLKIGLDGATGAIIGLPTQAGQVSNCGFSVSGSTATIAGYEGTSLSASNPCVVAVKSSTAGRVALAYFTANVTFTFGATSDTDGNDFGLTNSVDWASNMPFFIGVVYNGTTPFFTISRGPIQKSGAANTDLCQKADVDCDAQSDVMVLTTGLTLASWVNLPITQVGWFEMTYATTGGAWTALTSVTDGTGFNKDYKKLPWAMVLGQNGAAASKYTKNNSGTGPTWTANNDYYYWIDDTGWVKLEAVFGNSAGGTAGSGAFTLQVSAPYTAISLVEFQGVGNSNESAGTTQAACRAFIARSTATVSFTTDANAAIQNQDQSSTSRFLEFGIEYQAF